MRLTHVRLLVDDFERESGSTEMCLGLRSLVGASQIRYRSSPVALVSDPEGNLIEINWMLIGPELFRRAMSKEA